MSDKKTLEHIVIVNGIGGCGKTTFQSLCKKVAHRCVFIDSISSIDYVKEVAKSCGWTGTKTEKDRSNLHSLKLLMESWDNNLIHSKVLNKIKSVNAVLPFNGCDRIFFVDIRESYNIENFKSYCITNGYDCKTLLIKRDNFNSTEPQEIIDDVYNYKYDYIVNNSGTLEDLENEAISFIKEVYNIEICYEKISQTP